MESLLVQLPALLKLCVAALIFAIGLGSSLGDLTYLGRRPGLLLLAVNWRLLLQLQGPGMAALVALMIVALAIGHWLGGPTEDDRTALAIACATRHVGLAVLVPASFPGLRTVAVVAAYSVASLLVSIPYLAWRRRGEVATGDAQRGK